MNNMEMLQNNTELLEQLDKAQSPEEIATVLRAEGYEVTDENAKAAYEYKCNGELNEDMLDQVAGGFGITAFLVTSYVVFTIAVYGAAYAGSKMF